MNDMLSRILEEDMEVIMQELSMSEIYSFPDDLARRENELGLSDVKLGARVLRSHTTIEKWRTGKAMPKGREAYKELAMALGMTEEEENGEISRYLLCNGYYPLNVKNPLDSIARITLLRHKGAPDMVKRYRDYISSYGFIEYEGTERVENLKTEMMNNSFHHAVDQNEFTLWLKDNESHYSLGNKEQDYHTFLEVWIRCFLGESSKPHTLHVWRSLALMLRDLLYRVDSNENVVSKNLHEKLIALGIYLNMTEDEMDLLLENARQQKLSESVTRFDQVIRLAVNCAHLRYPYYEYDNAKTVLSNLKAMQGSITDENTRTVISGIMDEYQRRLPGLKAAVEYYEDNKEPGDDTFEEAYTSRSDKSLMDYIYDIVSLMKKRGILLETETAVFLSITKRDEMT